MTKMFQVIAMWNLSKFDEELSDIVKDIELRGYNTETFLTGEFARKISTHEIRPLSVSNISDIYCLTRRDLYFYKGVNRLRNRQQSTWGGKAGYIVERYIDLLKDRSIDMEHKYSTLIQNSNGLHGSFLSKKEEDLKNIKSLEKSIGIKEGDTDWFLKLLNNHGRAELGIKILHSLLKEENSLDMTHVQKREITPNTVQTGINSPATSDFIVPKFAIVGDIKTGVEFKPHFQLTCAGYALAYENEKGKNSDINWGIIYFFPTRNPSAYVRPLTFAQVYIFPIDDNLRQWFLDVRDEAYNIISKKEPPDFTDEKEHCEYCKFKEYCKSKGLELSNHG